MSLINHSLRPFLDVDLSDTDMMISSYNAKKLSAVEQLFDKFYSVEVACISTFFLLRMSRIKYTDPNSAGIITINTSAI